MNELVLFNSLASDVSSPVTDYTIWDNLDYFSQLLFNEVFGPLFDNIKGFLNFAGDLFPPDMILICISGLTTLLVLRILHGASSGG